MRHLIIALIIAVGAAACGDEPECFDIKEKEAGYGSPRGLLTIKAYLYFDEGKKIEIRAPVRLEAHDHCMTGTTTINRYLEPGFLSVDCQEITEKNEQGRKELGEIRRKTGVVAGFLSPLDEDLVSEIDLQDQGSARVDCFYNTE